MSKENKEDLIAIALYSMFYSKYKEGRKFEYELIEHLSKNYNFKKGFSAEDLVTDAMYGSESDLKDFLKSLKQNTMRKSQ